MALGKIDRATIVAKIVNRRPLIAPGNSDSENRQIKSRKYAVVQIFAAESPAYEIVYIESFFEKLSPSVMLSRLPYADA